MCDNLLHLHSLVNRYGHTSVNVCGNVRYLTAPYSSLCHVNNFRRLVFFLCVYIHAHKVTSQQIPWASTKRCSTDGVMLGQRCRRWPSIKQTMVHRLLCVGTPVNTITWSHFGIISYQPRRWCRHYSNVCSTFVPRSGIQVSKKQKNSSTLSLFHSSTLKIIYCGELPWPKGSVLDFRAPGLEFRIMCDWQCHLIHITILWRFSWPSLTNMCTHVA